MRIQPVRFEVRPAGSVRHERDCSRDPASPHLTPRSKATLEHVTQYTRHHLPLAAASCSSCPWEPRIYPAGSPHPAPPQLTSPPFPPHPFFFFSSLLPLTIHAKLLVPDRRALCSLSAPSIGPSPVTSQPPLSPLRRSSLQTYRPVSHVSIMATEAEGSTLTKVDSAVGGVSPTEEKKMGHRRTSSSVTGVYNINDLGSSSLLALAHPMPIYPRSFPTRPCTPSLGTTRPTPLTRSPCREGGQGAAHRQGDAEAQLEAQHQPGQPGRQRGAQEAADDAAGQEDRPALPHGPRGHGAQHEGRHYQRCARRHPQADQKEGAPPLFVSVKTASPLRPPLAAAMACVGANVRARATDRRTTNWTCRSWPASSGTRRRAGRA